MLVEHSGRQPNLSLRYILDNVELSFEQLARLCGVSRRQLSYWIGNGIVPSPEVDPLATIKCASLIRVRMQQGDTLRRAAQRVQEYYQQYRANLSSLAAMSDEERGQQLTRQLEELQQEVERLRKNLVEPTGTLIDLRSLTEVLRNLSLNELLSQLPHSRPTPELIIRLQQSVGHLRLAQLGLGINHHSHRP